MKYIFIIIFVFSHLANYGQKQKKIAVSDSDKLELKENISYIGKDTLVINKYENGEILSKGKYALNKSGEITYLKVGHWIQYYRNGNIESKGDYEISSYLNCGPGGLDKTYYSYKVGKWEYFNANNTIDAAGNYINFKAHIENQCKVGTDLIFMKTSDQWDFPNGKDENLIIRINSSFFMDGFNQIQYYLKKDNSVTWGIVD